MLARKFSSLGSSLCPRAWRARNATLRPSRVPRTYASEGSPNGVCCSTSCASLKPGMWYRPLPPIMPISACCKCAPDGVGNDCGTADYTRPGFAEGGRQTAKPSLSWSFSLTGDSLLSQLAKGPHASLFDSDVVSLRANLCDKVPRSRHWKGPWFCRGKAGVGGGGSGGSPAGRHWPNRSPHLSRPWRRAGKRSVHFQIACDERVQLG